MNEDKNIYKIKNPVQHWKRDEFKEIDRYSKYADDNSIKKRLEDYVLEHFNGNEDRLFYLSADIEEFYPSKDERYKYNDRDVIRGVSYRKFECKVDKDGNVRCYEHKDTICIMDGNVLCHNSSDEYEDAIELFHMFKIIKKKNKKAL